MWAHQANYRYNSGITEIGTSRFYYGNSAYVFVSMSDNTLHCLHRDTLKRGVSLQFDLIFLPSNSQTSILFSLSIPLQLHVSCETRMNIRRNNCALIHNLPPMTYRLWDIYLSQLIHKDSCLHSVSPIHIRINQLTNIRSLRLSLRWSIVFSPDWIRWIYFCR